MLTFEDTVTVYNSRYNKGTGFDDYYRTVIQRCSWFGKYNADREGTGLTDDKLFKVRILEGLSRSDKAYASPEDYTDPDTQYTLTPGTIILKGEGPPAPANGDELAALTADRPAAFKVLDYHDNRRVGIRHLYVEGK